MVDAYHAVRVPAEDEKDSWGKYDAATLAFDVYGPTPNVRTAVFACDAAEAIMIAKAAHGRDS